MSKRPKPQPKPRQQASAIPFRIGDRGLEFCLITTRRSERWAFPKGKIASGQTAQAAALQEAHEEAGLTGSIVAPNLGRYSYKKRGQRQSVVVMLMRVDGVSDDWHESAERNRRWVTPSEAFELLDRATLQGMLEVALRRLDEFPTPHYESGQRSIA